MMRFRKTRFAGVRQGRKGVRGVRRERRWKRLIYRFFMIIFVPLPVGDGEFGSLIHR
jgi:hypothetical protein